MTEMTAAAIADVHHHLAQKAQERPLLPKHARRAVLKQLQNAFLKNEEKIFQALTDDLGRPRFEAYVAEIAIIKEELALAIRSLSLWAKKRVVKTPIVFQPGISYVEPMPKGLVLIIAPWNYPFQLSLVPLISAIAAGNCVILKPSELAPASARVIADMINDNLDTNWFRVICGGKSSAQALLDLPFDHIFYTGSTTVGREVMKKAAEHLTPVTLELGGKSPVIVDDTADLSLATKRILWGKCLNAGQTCIAPDYVLIEEHRQAEFIEHARKHLTAMFGAHKQSAKSFGRIVNQHHFARLQNYLQDGTIVLGGEHDAHENFIEPTLLINVKPDAPAMTDEIFGPILPIITVKSINDAIRFINARPHPLALYLFSTNKATIRSVLEQTLSGGVVINDTIAHCGIIDLPFGGVRHSGIGSYHGLAGFETFSHLRSVHRRANLLDLPIKYAPYTDRKLALARMVL